MKDEKLNDTTMEACFLKAKAYCYTISKGKETVKRYNKATIKNQITIEDYTNAV